MPAKRTLAQLGMPKTTFYRWYDLYLTHGPKGLDDSKGVNPKVWNRIADVVRSQIIDMALEHTDLSPRELAVRFCDEKNYFVSEASVYSLLKAQGLITSPAYIVMKSANEFKEKTTAPNQMWQTETPFDVANLRILKLLAGAASISATYLMTSHVTWWPGHCAMA